MSLINIIGLRDGFHSAGGGGGGMFRRPAEIEW